MDKFFKLRERGSSVRVEVLGGLTTFFAMAYILFVNPNYLAVTGMNWGSVFTATCIASAIGSILTGLLSNTPFAQAPGMGLNAFFAFTVATGAAGYGMGYSYQQGLTIVFLSGIIFLLVAVSPLREKVIASIPASLKAAISAGIGLFIAFIGLLGSGEGLIRLDEANAITALNFVTENGLNYGALITLAGVILIGALMAWRVRGAVFIGILGMTVLYYVIGIPTGLVTPPPLAFSFENITLSGTFFAFDFDGTFQHGFLALVTAVISFALIDCFDTVGALVGIMPEANLVDKDGKMQGGDRALIADAIATVAGACLGTSTVTTYAESSTGIAEGARTGLSSVVVGVLFLLALLLAPIAGLIPAAATAPALIIVGVLMLKNAAKVAWSDMEEAVPAFLTIAMMPFAYSISDGIGFGVISYTLIKVFRGKGRQVPGLMYGISLLYILMYVLQNI